MGGGVVRPTCRTTTWAHIVLTAPHPPPTTHLQDLPAGGVIPQDARQGVILKRLLLHGGVAEEEPRV